MLRKLCRWACYVFTCGWVVLHLLNLVLPVPYLEANTGVTLIFSSKQAQGAVANALAVTMGVKSPTLNTETLDRFLFPGGSLDFLRHPDPEHMYEPVALYYVLVDDPIASAATFTAELEKEGIKGNQADPQPDKAFRKGDVVLVLSSAFRDADGSGFGFLFRKKSLWIHGPRPQ